MKEHSIYMDVPGAPGVSLWYAAQPSKRLDTIADAVIGALKAEKWYDQAMLKLGEPKCRLVCDRLVYGKRAVVVLEIPSREEDMRAVVKGVVLLKGKLEAQLFEQGAAQ